MRPAKNPNAATTRRCYRAKRDCDCSTPYQMRACSTLAHNRFGRVLPVWQGCRLIARDELFLMKVDQAASLDDRYFGPAPFTAIVSRAVPLWTSAQH
jgi:type IV secretory pathway protease TraF